jgi:hypothetical protein
MLRVDADVIITAISTGHFPATALGAIGTSQSGLTEVVDGPRPAVPMTRVSEPAEHAGPLTNLVKDAVYALDA